ncbi:hypothetical protein OS493_023310 [Desmophyllum pertusum]|uniref:Uncharacterized protein n=1 Tax=Desmophyllum pertusum TaxID=174260 RepID=A0A9X0CFV0_9CNID|nr:hypothetical protein OS493_023310 [Desmophyllum pertusum]
MSLRSTLKVAKYGLFYFEMAKSTSIVQTKNIKKVITRDNMSNGSRFLLQYGKEVLEATIIGVAGSDESNKESQPPPTPAPKRERTKRRSGPQKAEEKGRGVSDHKAFRPIQKDFTGLEHTTVL